MTLWDFSQPLETFYSEDQPRDEHGRFGPGGGEDKGDRVPPEASRGTNGALQPSMKEGSQVTHDEPMGGLKGMHIGGQRGGQDERLAKAAQKILRENEKRAREARQAANKKDNPNSPSQPPYAYEFTTAAGPPQVSRREFVRNYKQQLDRRHEIEIDLHARLSRVFATQSRVVHRRLQAIRKTMAVPTIPLTADGQPQPVNPTVKHPVVQLRAEEVFMGGFDDLLSDEMDGPISDHAALIGGALVGVGLFGTAQALNAQAQSHVDGTVENLAKTGENAIANVEGVLNDVYHEGGSYDDMMGAVEHLFDQLSGSGAGQMARSAATGLLAGMGTIAARLAGVPTQRMWMTQDDDRVRGLGKHDQYDHVEAHGQVVGLDEPFVVSGEDLQYPGDPNGELGNVINCRCYVVMVSEQGDEIDIADSSTDDVIESEGAFVAQTETFYSEDQPRDEHGRFGEGSGDAATIPGIGNVNAFLAANPQRPGEELFAWQGRVTAGLEPAARHELLFQARETYPPVGYIAKGADRYRAEHGLPNPRVNLLQVPAPLAKGEIVARKFDTIPDQSNDPKVQAAYEDFKSQSAAMFDFMTRPESEGGLGITITFSPNEKGDPYPTAKAQADDLRDNHHMTTQSGLGGEHSLLTRDEYDHFRAVHDVFGHAAVGGGFDRHGEYEAWLQHRSMYTGAGADAMSSEYHGVNTSVWAGKETGPSPGTGKSILLPETLIRNPFDEKGNLVRAQVTPTTFATDPTAPIVDEATTKAISHLIDKAKIDDSFAAQYDKLPWHFPQGGQVTPTPVPMKAQSITDILANGRATFYSDDQPRDDHGRFGPGDGSSSKEEETKGTGTKNDPIQTKDPVEAARLLGEGKYVQLDQPRTASTMLDHIAKMVDQAKALGEKAPNYDLCKASVSGTNLFCAESKGIPRIRMPQLSGKPEPGSWADKNLPKDAKGEVNLAPAFMEHLASKGIDVESKTVPAEVLRASQNELNGAKVAGMARALEEGTLPKGSIFTTKDDYVVDGHHRWAANVAAELKSGQTMRMPVEQIQAPIIKVLAIANNFTESRGIPHAAVGQNLKA